VGCIPKKMMHYAATLAEQRADMKAQGWPIQDGEKPDWDTMVTNVQKHIRSLNWGYKTDMIKLKIKYLNAYASFVDPHTIQLEKANGEKSTVTADKIVIACGGRPSYPEIPGAKEFGITSDDMFSLKKAPGKTLVVGASYVALECSGFLTALGYDTTVMVRSILLRGFDQDMANLIGEHMELYHTKFIHGATPSKLERTNPDGPITVTYKSNDGSESTGEYDSVLFAMGRYAVTEGLNLANAGLVAEKNGKFKVDENDQTNIDHIFAIGDVQFGKLELTPTAIKAGQLLAQRLFTGGTELMDYTNVPTTVFTPIEYGTCGLTEVEAKEKFGAENISTYHTKFKPLEWSYDKTAAEGKRTCYVKVLVNKADANRVVGFHICAPNAGEITQGVGIGFKCGMTKE
jgi:thioredoxin reductase (NADPH)